MANSPVKYPPPLFSICSKCMSVFTPSSILTSTCDKCLDANFPPIPILNTSNKNLKDLSELGSFVGGLLAGFLKEMSKPNNPKSSKNSKRLSKTKGK